MDPISSHQGAPMLKINSDILLTIVSLLTKDFSADDALKSIRCCSQLCQFSRQVILDSPSIWGKLINFNDFYYSKDQWMEEVLRRSGSCLLWISGHIHGGTLAANRSEALRTFFFSVLNDHWGRIQKLRIYMDDSDEKDGYNWRAIYRPAPHLQVFCVNPPPISSAPLFPLPCLFADHAPSLRAFNMQEALPVSLTAPWLYTLRVVHLQFPLDFLKVLDALSTMHLLESLTLSIPSFIPDSPTTRTDDPIIHLPNLSLLSILANLSISMRVIAALQVPPGCSFRMHILFTDFITEPISPAPLVKLAHNYFQSNHPKNIWLTSRRCEFRFSDSDPANPNTLGMSTSFFFIHTSSSFLPVEASNALARAMSLPLSDMHSVIHLHVHAEIPFAVDICRHVFVSIHSIETITINQALICYLRFLEPYPELRIVRIEGWKDGQQCGVINSFQQSRNAAGRPVLILGVPPPK
ncbi:hypothetical protein GALMADRAFT_161209 [Galerina marginata CBS 339.88]|uniref:F-box domain-containing protein n=1 Tax=Galerina marginata (strain CBS 339.88) TaxID=685588 RepID=A0A067SK81_GALM3|nr:hypothetical protein GALMADRAFT_161209 [Galerina marginata CBS 339.88]